MHNGEEWVFSLQGTYSMPKKHWQESSDLISYSTTNRKELENKYGSMDEYYRLISFERSYIANIHSISILD